MTERTANEVLAIPSTFICCALKIKALASTNNRKERRFWVKPSIAEREREMWDILRVGKRISFITR